MGNKIRGLVGFVVLVLFDQWTKYLAFSFLRGKENIAIIKNVFELQYLENRGAAFGMLQNKRIFLLGITVAILALIVYFYWKMPNKSRFAPIRICLVVIGAGAVGNMIDRFIRQYVVDFFYFKLINFPIFNVADCYVVVGAIAAFLLVAFYYKESDFSKE